MTCSCCQSFSPNTATAGRTRAKSWVTTVATPRKCPGRRAPQSPSESPLTSTKVWCPGGYIAPGVGVKTASTPTPAHLARSPSRSRG